MCLFTTRKDSLIHQDMSRKRGVSLLTLTVKHPVETLADCAKLKLLATGVMEFSSNASLSTIAAGVNKSNGKAK